MSAARLDIEAPHRRFAAARRWLHWGARLGIAGLFIYAAVPKLLDAGRFAEDINHYRILPEAWVAPLALGLPVLELVAGLALLIPAYTRGAALLCAVMLGGFAIAMAQSKLRGIDLECGCFGAASEARVSWTKVTLDLLLAMLAGWLVRPLPNTPRAPDHAQAAPPATQGS
jgi:putative oxidoreductase